MRSATGSKSGDAASDQRLRLRTAQLQPLLAHVDSEEACLRSLSRLLKDVPLTLVEDDALRTRRVAMNELLKQAEQLEERRRRVLIHTGRLIGIEPDRVTFSRLIRQSEASAAAVLVPAQHRLQRVVRELQMLSASVGWIIAETRSINSTVLFEVMGEVTSDRYNASGQRSLDPSGVRFETRS